ncbi:hypothetical protein HGA88_01145 [Candidatus Roizmanbacteria bacterium]|nr:hypothetical protein [Candidatus Roizmanbacteria bacterium]
MHNLLAQQFTINNQRISGPLNINGNKNPSLADIISAITNFMIPFAAIILLLVLIWGGYNFMMSQGNPEKVKSAKAKITTGLIGFILLIVSYVIVSLVSMIFGLGKGLF